METFLKPRFDLFQQGECLQFAHDVIKACIDADATKLKIDAETNDLNTSATSGDAAYGGPGISTLTEEVIGSDHLRDDAITGIRNVALGYCKHYDPALRAAGKIILASLNKYSTHIARENLANETTIIRNWYADTKSHTNIKDAIQLLNLKSWTDYLNTQNEAFDVKYVQRSQVIGNNAQLTTVADVLPTLQKKYRVLIDVIEALHTLDKTKLVYTPLVNQINGITQQYNTRAKTRQAVNAAAKAKKESDK
ncbi:unnamed protein product [Rotaria sp. Silwood1]|nr:unnamed protein product [Rotaria sp. Silwood1]CAF4971376.1 unnamed protein product [Rotaria sp. Silwood1]